MMNKPVLSSQPHKASSRKAAVALAVVLLLPHVLCASYEGFGSATVGGNQGTEVEVTSLEDSGPGTLREALKKGNSPYRIVFRVAGTIQLQRPVKLKQQSFVTIDGSTAPAPGITLVGNAFYVEDSHDVILSHLRVRNSRGDGLTIRGSHHIVIDHCSLTNAGDENIGLTQDCHDVTISWCLIGDTRGAFGLRPKGVLIANFGKPAVTNVTLHHNLFTHESQRNPQVSTAGLFDIRNNLILYWQAYGIRMRRGARGNIINNVFKTTENAKKAVLLAENPGPVYIGGNQGPENFDVNQVSTTPSPFPVAQVTTDPATEVEQKVLQNVGAQPRDAVDRVLVSQPPPVPIDRKPKGKPDSAPPHTPREKEAKANQALVEGTGRMGGSARESMR